MRFEPITTAHFDQRYNKIFYYPCTYPVGTKITEVPHWHAYMGWGEMPQTGEKFLQVVTVLEHVCDVNAASCTGSS